MAATEVTRVAINFAQRSGDSGYVQAEEGAKWFPRLHMHSIRTQVVDQDRLGERIELTVAERLDDVRLAGQAVRAKRQLPINGNVRGQAFGRV